MGKKATVFKALAAGLLALVFVLTTPAGGTLQAEAAQFTGNQFGVGFAGEEYATMHKADGWSNGGMFNCTWRAANIWFDGYLNIKIDRDYATGGYSAGEYRTNDTFGYGMYDVSFKAIKNDGVVTSFFTYTGPSDGTQWDEIDIEVLGKDTTKVQFNYYTNGVGGHEYMHNLGFDASQAFHQYGFLWLPGRITWYVDGVAVHTATSNIPTTPGKIMMNAWNGIGVDEWLKPYNGATPLVAQYDWINYKTVDTGSSNNNNNTNNNNTSSGSFNSTTPYKIINRNSGKALDIAWGSPDNGANVLQYSYNGYNNQKWYLEPTGDGYYVFKSVATGKVVDVSGKSTSNGGDVIQWQKNGGWNQQWKIVAVDGGCYKFINRHSGKAMDVSGRSTADNADVIQWDDNGGWNQHWKIEPAW